MRRMSAWTAASSRVASTVTNLMMLALLGLAVFVAIAAPVLIPIVTPGFDLVQLERTIELTRIMLFSPILLALGSLATTLLNAKGRFGASAAAPLVYNGAIILAAVFLAPSIGVEGLALGVVFGSLGHLAIQIRPLNRLGFRYEPLIDLADSAARQALLLMAPRAIGLGASQMTFVVATSLASGLPSGSVSAFAIAFTVFQIPFGVIGVPMGVVALPSLSRSLALGEVRQYTSLVVRSLRLILFVMLPIAGLGMILRRQVITLLFGYGEFTAEDIDMTANTLLYLLIALASESMIAILARAFYAGRDTRTPVTAAVLAVLINVPLSIAMVGTLGLSGIALAIAIGSWTEATFLIVQLWRRLPGFDPGSVGLAGLASGIAAVGASVATLASIRLLDGLIGTDPSKPQLLGELIVATAVGGLVYVGASLLLRIPELGTIVRLMLHALRRPAGSEVP